MAHVEEAATQEQKKKNFEHVSTRWGWRGHSSTRCCSRVRGRRDRMRAKGKTDKRVGGRAGDGAALPCAVGMQRRGGCGRRRRAVMAERGPHRATASSRNQGAGHVTGLREERKTTTK
jgi:hypothetical protein